VIHSCRTNGSKVLDSGVPVGVGSPGRRIRLREPGCPGRGIEDFTDAFARRIASFGKVAVTGIKKLVDVATMPDDAEFAAGLQAFFAAVGRAENRPVARLLFQHGLQQPDGIETDLGSAIGKLRPGAPATAR